MKDKNEKKATSEKPVSLAPLNLQEALEALLKVKPKPKEKDQEEKQEQESKEKPGG